MKQDQPNSIEGLETSISGDTPGRLRRQEASRRAFRIARAEPPPAAFATPSTSSSGYLEIHARLQHSRTLDQLGVTGFKRVRKFRRGVTWSRLRREVLRFRSRRRLHLRNLARLLLLPLLCLLLEAPVVLLDVVPQLRGQGFNFLLKLPSLRAITLVWKKRSK